MEFQQGVSEQDLNIEQLIQENMGSKYMDFYAGLEMMNDEQAQPNFQHLEAALYQGLLQYHDCCSECQHSNHIKQNPRVNDIPTVYLVTCIKTQHVPINKRWRIDHDEQTKQQKRVCDTKRDNQHKETFRQINKNKSKGIQKQIQRQYNEKCSHFLLFDAHHKMDQQKPICNKRYELYYYERPWKTQFITIQRQYYLQKNNKQKKLMHKECHSYQTKTKQNKNKKYMHRQKFRNRDQININQKRFMMIIKNHQSCEKIKNGKKSERYNSVKSFQKEIQKISIKSRKVMSNKSQKINYSFQINKKMSFEQHLNRYEKKSQNLSQNKKIQLNQIFLKQIKNQYIKREKGNREYDLLQNNQNGWRKRSRFMEIDQLSIEKPKDKYLKGTLRFQDQLFEPKKP